jgi:16S rRNA (guanine527-N7)-methyltransferase
LPGIPIKIVRPEIALTMIESRRRRASFLSTVVRDLRLRTTRVIAARAEDVVGELEGSFGAVVMRCAGDPRRILPLARRFAARNGLIVASGPPKPADGAEWVSVPGVKPGSTRAFVVTRQDQA